MIRLVIGFHNRQLGIHGASIGKTHAGFESKLRGAVGQRSNSLRGLDRSDDNECFNWLGRAAFDPIGREATQPH